MWIMKRLWIWLLLAPLAAGSQITDSLTGELPPEGEYLVEELSGIYDEGIDAADIASESSLTSFRRIDLNNTEPLLLAEELRLSPAQTENLAKYLRDYGPLLTIYELKAIPGFDSATIRRIVPAIILQPKENKMSFQPAALLRQTHGTLLIRFSRTLESQHGYIPESSDTTLQARYLGDPSKILVRFQAKVSGRISLGVLAEKDAGEQLFKGTQKQGFDHYKGFLAINFRKIVRSLIIGHYQLAFGQGLTINTSAMMTSSRGLYQPYKFTDPARPNTSSSESGGLQGAAADIRAGKIGCTLFFSQRKMDARMDPDDQGQVLGWITSGYHRTLDEINGRNRVRCLLYGGHASFRNHFLQVGITAFQSSFQPDAIVKDRLYKRFMDPGREMTVLGSDIRILLPHVVMFGETSYRVDQQIAVMAGMLWYASARFRHTLVFRYYPSGLYHPFSCAPGRHQPSNNEKGFLWSFEAMLSKKLTCTGSADIYWFPWISYRMDKPACGSEFYLLSVYKPDVHTQCILRFLLKNGMQNDPGTGDVIRASTETSTFLTSLQINCMASSTLTFKNQLYFTVSRIRNGYGKPGYLFSSDVQFKPARSSLELIMRYALFDIRNSSDRIYAYERDVLYAFSAPAYHARGIRFYVMIRYGLGKWFDLWIRYSRSRYPDQSTIGTGPDEIESSHKSDVKIQVRYRF